MSGITAVGFFLFSTFFSFVIFGLWLRIALRYFKVSSLNPLSQMIYSMTNPIVNPVNEILKLKHQPQIRYDYVAFGVLVAVEFIKIICLSLLVFHTIVPIGIIIIYVLADLIIQPCDLMFYAILIRVVMSYANPGWQHPLADILRTLTEPLYNLGRRIVPNISGFDFAPIVISIILKMISLFITYSLPLRLL